MELHLQRVDTHTAVGPGQVESHLQQVDTHSGGSGSGGVTPSTRGHIQGGGGRGIDAKQTLQLTAGASSSTYFELHPLLVRIVHNAVPYKALLQCRKKKATLETLGPGLESWLSG